MKKRLLSALMVFCMVLTLLPVSAFAAGSNETVDRIRLMDKSDWETATIARAGYDTDDVSWVTVTSIRFLTEDGSYTNSDVVKESLPDCYSNEGYFADNPGQKIPPSEIDRVVVTLNYAHAGWNVGKIEYGVKAVFHREDFDLKYTEGVLKYAELTLKDNAASVGEYAVTFMYKPIGATNWSIYDILYVDGSTSLGENMPANPATGTQHFVGWNTSEDGTGNYFDANTTVNEDIIVYGIKVTAGGATAYHVMNGSEDWLKQEVLDRVNNNGTSTIDDVNIGTIQVNGTKENTNPNYRFNGWREYDNIAQNYWYIYNIDLYSPLGIDWNRDVPVEDIQSITLTGTIGNTPFDVKIPHSDLAFKTVSGAGVDVIVEIWLTEALEGSTTTYPVIGTIDNGGTVENGNQNVEKGKASQAMVFKPADGYEITGVAVNGSSIDEFQVDAEGSYTYPAQSSVTQEITVTVTTTAKKPSYEGYTIQVSFCRPDDQAPITIPQTVTSGQSAIPPVKDGNKTITGWKLDSVDGALYSGTYDFNSLATLVTEKDGWNNHDQQGYLTFYAIYGEPEPAQRTAQVNFIINASDDHGSYENGLKEVPYTWTDMSSMITPPTVVCDEGYEHVGWVLNGATTTEMTVPNIQVDPNLAYFAEGETTGYLTVYPVFKAVEAPQRTAQVNFIINASDDHGSYENGLKEVPYTWTDMSSMITPPTVVCDEGYEHVGWVLNGATTTEMTVPNIQVDPNLAYFAEGETTGYLTVYPVFKAVEAPQRTAQVNFIINASDDHGSYENGLKEVPYTWTDMSSMITPPTVVCDEGYEHVGWVLNGATTTEMTVPNIQVDPNLAYFAEGETTGYLTVYPVFKAVEAPQRTAQVNFIINASDDHGSYENGLKEVPYTWTDMSSMITPPTVVCDEGYEHVGWVLNGATTTEMTVPNIQVDPNLAYFAEGETTGYLTVYPVFKAVEAPQRTAQVNFIINASDDHGSYENGLKEVPYTWTDMSSMITPPTVVCDEGYEHVGWVLNGATTTEMTVPNIQVDPNLAYFAEGETTGYLTVYPVFKAVEAETKSVGLNYWDVVNNVQVAEGSLTVAADATNVNTSTFTDIPEGYELVWTGDLPIVDGWVWVEVRPADTETKSVGLNYWDVVNNVQVAEGSLTVAADATNVNTSTFTDIPEGYELVWTGDLPIVDGWVWVEVRPADTETKSVGLNYWDVVNNVQVAEGSLTVAADATNVNTSTFTDIPEGYELVWTGDLPIVDGWVWVEVRPTGTETKSVGLNYWDVVNNVQVAEGSLTVAADATNVNTSTFTDIPEGYELVWTGDLPIVDGWVWVEVRPVDTETKSVGLNYWDVVNNVQVAEGSLTVAADATNVNTSTFTDIPEGYELVWTGDLPIVDGWVWVEVRPADTETKSVGLNYWDVVNNVQVAEGSLTVAADATNVNTSTFTDIPEGYELVWTGDLPIVDGWVWVEVRPADTETKSVGLNYWDVVNNVQVAEGSLTVAADATNVNTSTFTDIPEGYELVWTGDLPIVDGWVWVEVRPADTETKSVGLNYWDVVNNVQVAEGSLTVAADATNVNTSTFTDIPEGYELVWTGDLPIVDGWVWVEVRPADTETKSVGLNYWDVVNNVQVAEGSLTVAADATNVNTSTFTDIPEGYELVWTGDLPIVDGWVWVEVRPADTETKSVGLNYWDVVNNVQVAEGSLTVAADATNVNTSTFTDIPEGYELVWTGDLPIVDGWVWVEVRPADTETKSVGLNYWDVVNNVQVAEGSLTVAADATNVNTSTFTDIPEGYELVWTGDLPIVDGWVWVEVRPVEAPDPATQSVTVTYWDTENDQQVGESFTITVDADATYVNTSSFTDIPAGYELAWTGDLPIVDGAVRVELRPIEEPVPATYTITASAENGGSISPNGTTTVNEGDDLTFTIRANSNYDIDEVYVDGKSVGSVSRYTFSDVSEDHTIRATFTRESSGGGSGGSGSSGGGSDSDSTGNLTISLDVTGGSDEFTFTVTFTDEDDDELNNKFHYNGDSSGRIGSGDEITLADGDEIVIRNLPEGTRYEVAIETVEGYTYSATGEEGTIRTRGNEAEFTVSPVAVAADPSVTGVADWLNTSDHIAYLTGYPGGNFGPDSSMTRAEVAQMFYALLNNKNVTITKTFADVPSDAWYATAVNTLGTLGMVTGDSNGNFRPNDPITRAEFCVIALAFAYEPEDYSCSFYDVSRSDWFYPYVAQASTYGWIGGYTSGNFGPNDQITRAQVTTIVNNMLGREADQDYVADHQDDLVQFNDLSQSHWAYYDVMEAVNAHDFTKTNGNESWD